jgi:hypothetical protein
MNPQELRTEIRTLLTSQHYGILASTGPDGNPHCSILAFIPTDELTGIVFATARNTRKYRYLMEHGKVSFFVDNRHPEQAELLSITGIEILGRVRELSGRERFDCQSRYAIRHPDLTDFVCADNSALMYLAVERYEMVDHFQHMRVFEPDRISGLTQGD